MPKFITGISLLVIFVGLYIFIQNSSLSNNLFDPQSLQAILNKSGLWGPLLIIILMAGAIVMSPLPSAPIAIASGFVYGHGWGTLYILIGAEVGALIAFSIARLLGYEAMHKRFGNQINAGWLGSGKHLMLAICVSRLIPFISFDVVSYVAGLTRISYLQFAMATLIGIIPASFLLAHFGGEMVGSDFNRIATTVLLLGVLTVVPVIISIAKRYISKPKK